MKLFISYLKSKIRTIFVFLLFTVIFLAVFVLYHLPIKMILYPAILCIIFGTVFIIIDFIRTKKKHNELELIKSQSAEMINNLPEPKSLTENDLCDIIENMQREVIDSKAEYQNEYNEMIDYYTVWAHQIKTPIASMKLTLQNEDSDLSRKLNSDLFRTQQYADMVLAFLRLGSQSSDYVFREYSIDEIIRPCIRKFSSDFIMKKLSLRYEPINGSIVTDEKWFSFMIEQLLSNSLKYTNSGEIKIFMTENSELCISDTGIGIAPQDLPRIFEKGYTGCNGRTDKNASGLGLYLCKRICDNLRIDIKVISQLGEGTTVALRFLTKM